MLDSVTSPRRKRLATPIHYHVVLKIRGTRASGARFVGPLRLRQRRDQVVEPSNREYRRYEPQILVGAGRVAMYCFSSYK